MKVIEIVFPIKPERKERPRFSRFGGVYTTKKNKDFENTMAVIARSYMNKHGLTPLTGLIHAEVSFLFERPKKTILLTPRMDIDNLIKSTFDGLNEVTYVDDTQISIVTASKEWSDHNMIILKLTEIKESRNPKTSRSRPSRD